jgi:PAS domain S-box-containing protein
MPGLPCNVVFKSRRIRQALLLDHMVSLPPATPASLLARGPLLLAALGGVVFGLAWILQGDEKGYWLPGLGIGIALVAWLGWRIVPILALELLAARWWTHRDAPVLAVFTDTLIHVAHIGLAWWLYHDVARGARTLDDPRSATIFLILVPGGLTAAAALLQTLLWMAWGATEDPAHILVAQLLLSRTVGILVTAPFLIAVGTALLLRHGLIDLELPPSFHGDKEGMAHRVGNRIELVGLTFATTLLGLLLLWSVDVANWMLWGCCLILIVWICIRQGLRGGCSAATFASLVLILVAQSVEITPPFRSAIQGHLLAFTSTALLLGVSASWIRANETRYRHVVNRIPFVLYSARLPYGIQGLNGTEHAGARQDTKHDLHTGPAISKLADIVLVSPAAEQVLGSPPESLLGPFDAWLERIEAEDRELVVASLGQLCLQKQPVTCEYRLRNRESAPPAVAQAPPIPRTSAAANFRWVRDTMTPHYAEDGLIDGWEGLVEDITEQRALSHDLRKMTNMLQVLVTNLPTGVYFVQAPLGSPILVNARARQLLGQREDLSAGLSHLSKLYRLHRPDGTEYPWEELPVSKALRLGSTCRANDIVVHRPDGRRIPLIAWAAPISLHNTGAPDAAVWVLEDWSAMQHAELALRESETRLRAVIETMGEGVIVQDAEGAIIDSNAAACTILSVTREQLMCRAGLTREGEAFSEDGGPFPRTEQPDQRALRNHQPVRGVILGLPQLEPDGIRWLLVSSVPLPVGPSAGLNHQRARVVTTFADITQQLLIQDSLRLAKDKYQDLVETLPFMLLQRDRKFNITYLNPAATQLTGHTVEEMMRPGFCESIIHPDDIPAFHALAATIAEGRSGRIEARLQTKGQGMKTVLALFHPNIHKGEVVGSTSLVIDITLQRRLEVELQQAKHLEFVGRLASGTVHDFNNLLQILLGLAGLAKYEVATDHPAWQHLTRIEEAGEQAAHLAGQLLTFSKQRPKQRRPIDLNSVVAQTLKLAKSVIPHEVTLDADLDPSTPLAQGDENPLKQVLMNLCINARDAMPAGGRLTIRTDRVTPPPMPLPDSNGAPCVHLSIQDTGHGMDEQIRQRIFEPFFSTKERGTGLGLSVVQQIIQEFGGRIEVSSSPNEGTRFDIWLLPAKAN